MSSEQRKKLLSSIDYWLYIRKNRRRSAWNGFVRFMACLVVFCTTYALILPAITLETDAYCAAEEHSHSDECYVQAAEAETVFTCSPVHTHTSDCYDAAGALVCQIADYVLHTHDALCYNAVGSLICPLPETKEHTHSDECYTVEKTAPGHTHDDSCYTNERLDQTCRLEETPGHAHGESCSTSALVCTTEFDPHVHATVCYESTLTCTAEEGADHTHGESCYTAALVCTTEHDTHVHSDGCYETTLICTTEETEGHTHSDTCFVTEKVLTCTQAETAETVESSESQRPLICKQDEIIAHTHTDSCYADGVCICGKLQITDHIHTQDCLELFAAEPVLICGLEAHIHSLACYSNPEADLETREGWEKALRELELNGTTAENFLAVAESQLGYQESKENYAVVDGTAYGYNRYGVWTGEAYAQWNETFVEFCLHYAGIEEKDFPRATKNIAWTTVLANAGMLADADYTPVPGDLVFFEEKFNSYVGIVSAMSEDGTITTILGDYENAVSRITFSEGDQHFRILGFAILPELEEAEPETTEQETIEPETTEPETTEPEATEPEATEPETTVPLTANMTFEYTAPEVTRTFAARAAFFMAPSALGTTSANNLMALAVGDYAASRSSSMDMTNMVKDVVIYHRANAWDNWMELGANENIQSSEQIRFAVQYQVPGKTLSAGNDMIYYQLPVGSIPEAKSGNVHDNSGALVGTYVITTSGLIEITFNDHYVAENTSGVAIDGSINFDTTVTALDTDNDGKINLKFSDSESVELEVEQTITNDLTVEKTAATIDPATGLLKYTVTVSSVNGTNDVVTLTDSLSNISFYSDDSHYLTVVDQNGNAVEVSKPNNGATYLSLTLPKMNAGSTYTLTYYAKVTSINYDSITASNSVTVKSKNENGHLLTDSAYTQTPFTNNMVQKSGTLNGDSVVWTVSIGQSGTPLAGWTLSDTVNGAALQGNVTISYVDGGSTVTETRPLPFTFPDGATGPATATYTTSLDYSIGGNSMTNTATLTPPSNTPPYPSYSDSIWVQDPSDTAQNYPLNKESSGLTVSGDKTTAAIGWTYTIDTSGGTIYTDGANGWYFDDYLKNDQFFTDAQWNDLLSSIEGALEAESAFNVELERTDVTNNGSVTYQYKSGDTLYAQVTAYTSGTTKIGFKVTVYQNLAKDKTIYLTYASTASLGDGTTQKNFQNGASINNKTWDSAAAEYNPVVTKMDGQNSSVSDTSHAQMDIKDGIVTWKIQVVLPAGSNSDVIITESLPSMVDLTTLALQLPNSAVICPTGQTTQVAYNNTTYPMVVSAVDSDNKFTITIPGDMAAAFADQKLIFTVTTKLNNSFTMAGINSEGLSYADLTNRVSVSTNGNEIGNDDHTQTITNQDTTQQLTKTAVKGESNIVTYTVEINPNASDLNPASDKLTIDDVMTFYSEPDNYWFGANLVSGSVKVYEVTTSADGTPTRTQLQDLDDYTYLQTKSGETGWVLITNTLQIAVPDEKHLILEYQYQLRGPENQGNQFNNVASIRELSDYGSSSNNTGFTITGSDAIANLSSINVYKVAAGNYSQTLPGAEYELYKWDSSTSSWHWDQNITSGEGKLEIQDLEKNVAYYLIEINAPAGYILDETRHYFLMYDSSAVVNNPVSKPDNFPNNAYVAKGGVVYITNETAATSATVEKVWKDANGNKIDAPTGSSVQVELHKVWNAPLSRTVGEPATVAISFAPHSYDSPTHSQTISAKVGDQITITLTTSGISNQGHAGLMQVTGTENIHIPYSLSGTTYTFTYLVNGDATLTGWYYPDVNVNSLNCTTSPAVLTEDMGVEETITLNADTGWTHTFNGLELYDLYTALEQQLDGAATGIGRIEGYYTYEVKETAINAGYTNNMVSYSEDNGTLVITNQPLPTTTVGVEKVWASDSVREDSVTAQLYQVFSSEPPVNSDEDRAKVNVSLNLTGANYSENYTGHVGDKLIVTLEWTRQYSNDNPVYAQPRLVYNNWSATIPEVSRVMASDNSNVTVVCELVLTEEMAAQGGIEIYGEFGWTTDYWSATSRIVNANEGKVPTVGDSDKLYETVTLSATNEWQYTWPNLPLYQVDSIGNITGYYSYYVLETGIDSSKYKVSYSSYDGTVTGGTITITNAPTEEVEETTEITVTKVWKAANGVVSSAPTGISYINFYLYQDGVLYENRDTTDGHYSILSTESWTKTITNLPAGHTYTVVEDSSNLGNYTTTISTSDDGKAITITNQEHPDTVTTKTSISVKKEWLSGANQDSVTVQLYQVATVNGASTTGTYGAPVGLTSEGSYAYTWNDLPASATVNGQAVTYTYYVREISTGAYNVIYSTTDAISSGTITVTNGPKTVDITVNKKWIYPDGSDAAAPRDTIEFQLYAVYETTEILVGTYTMDSSLTYTINDLTPGTYKIVETTTGYSETYQVNGESDKQQGEFLVNGSFTITNTVETVSLTVNKVWKASVNGTTPASITFKLYQNGNPYGEDSYTLSSSENWTKTFTNLPKYDANGNEYVYTVAEYSVSGYTSGTSTSGNTITITNTPSIDIGVGKSWKNSDGMDMSAPDIEVTFRLYYVLNSGVPSADYQIVYTGEPKDYEKYRDATVTASNLHKTFKELDLFNYDSNGNISGYYTYYVYEVPVDGYNTTYGEVDTSGDRPEITVTNTPIQTFETSITKVWKDSNGTVIAESDVPSGDITVTLYRSVNGTKDPDFSRELTLNTANSWKATVMDLLYWDSNGNTYTYWVEESNIPEGYTSTVTGSAQDGFTVTNTKKPTTDITVEKFWMDSSVATQALQFQLYRFESIEDTSTQSKSYTAEMHFQNDLVNSSSTFNGLITGPGTYTMSLPIATSTDTISQFYLLIKDGYDVFGSYDISNVSITSNGAAVPVDSTKIRIVQNWEDNGTGTYVATNNAKIEIYDYWGTTGQNQVFDSNSPIDPSSPFSGDLTITFTLSAPVIDLSGATSVGAVTLDGNMDSEETTAWQYTWTELPLTGKNSSGETVYYTYYVKELTTGYITTYSTNTPVTGGTITVTNDDVLKTYTYVTVEKVWQDASGNTIDAPVESIQFKLLRNGAEYDHNNDGTADIYTLPYDGQWKMTIVDLPQSDGTNSYTYTVEEITELEGYATTITGDAANGFTITNQLNSTEITVNKAWLDADGNPLENITVPKIQFYLYQNNARYDDVTYEITAENDWTTTISGLPMYDDNGVAYTYAVRELPVEGYRAEYSSEGSTLTITNHVDVTEIIVEKKWENMNGAEEKPVTVQLYQAEGLTTVYYDTYLGFAGKDWIPEIGARTMVTVSTSVTGAGSYSLYWDLEKTGMSPATEAHVFYIDIYDPHAALEDFSVSNLTIWADGTKVTPSSMPEPYYEHEYLRLMIFSNIHDTPDLIDGSSLEFSKSLQVDFTLEGPDGTEYPRDHDTTVPIGGGEPYGAPVVLSEGNEWKFTWEDLPLTNPDDPTISYTYYVVETTTGYATTYSSSYSQSNGTITVKNEPFITEELPYSVSLNVNKNWLDAEGKSYPAPEDSVEVELFRQEKTDSGYLDITWGTWGTDRTTRITMPDDGDMTVRVQFIGLASNPNDLSQNMGITDLPNIDESTYFCDVSIKYIGADPLGCKAYLRYNDWDDFAEAYLFTYEVTAKVTDTSNFAQVYATFAGRPAGTTLYSTCVHSDVTANDSKEEELSTPCASTSTLLSGETTAHTIGVKSIVVTEGNSSTDTTDTSNWISKGTYKLTAVNNWALTIDGLEPGTYKIVETTTGYTTTYTVGSGDPVSDPPVLSLASNGAVTVNNTVEKTSLTVNKVWSNADGSATTPNGVTKIQFYLYRNGEPYDADTSDLIIHTPYTLIPTDGVWTMTITNLPVVRNSDGKCEYTVEEIAIDGYYATYEYTTTTSNGNTTTATATITNTYDLTDITVRKVWNNADGTTTAPTGISSIQFHLYQNGLPYDADPDDLIDHTPYTITADTWEMTINGLPKTAADGTDYVYSVDEVDVDGYLSTSTTDGSTITITNAPSTQISVVKDWGDLESEAVEVQLWRYESDTGFVEYKVIADGETEPDLEALKALGNLSHISSATLSDDSGADTAVAGNTKTFEDLPLYGFDADGKIAKYYTYFIIENAPDYIKSYSGSSFMTGGTITITNVPRYTDLTVEKQWQDVTGAAITDPDVSSVTVSLLRNGEVIDTVTLSAENDWSTEFTHLDIYDDTGALYKYRFSEEKVSGYDVSYAYDADGNCIITNKKSNSTQITVTKKWQDSDGNDLTDYSGIQQIYYELYQVKSSTAPTSIYSDNSDLLVAKYTNRSSTIQVNVKIAPYDPSKDEYLFEDGKYSEYYPVGTKLKFTITTWGTPSFRTFVNGSSFWNVGDEDYTSVSGSSPKTYIYIYEVSEKQNIGIKTEGEATWSIDVLSTPDDGDSGGGDSGGGTDDNPGTTDTWTEPEGSKKIADGTLSYGENWTRTITGLPLYEIDTTTGQITGYYSYYIKEKESVNGNYELVSYVNNNGITTGEIIVTNKLPPVTPGYELPATGGSGTEPLTLGGLAMFLGAAYLLYADHKRRKRKA